jgi:hypothetical protein
MKKEDVYARMMHTPDDPQRAERRATLREAWKQLLPLHRALIDDASADYTANVGAVSGPGHLLHLFGATADPGFTARYIPILQRDVDVAIAHAAIRKIAGKLQK